MNNEYIIPDKVITEVERHISDPRFTKYREYHEDAWRNGLIVERTAKRLYGVFDELGFGNDGGTDLILQGHTIDVKGQAYHAGTPTKDWWINFADHQINHDTDYLHFWFLNTKKYIMIPAGWITLKDFIQKSEFLPKGHVNPHNKHHTAVCDTRMIQVSQLNYLDETKMNEGNNEELPF